MYNNLHAKTDAARTPARTSERTPARTPRRIRVRLPERTHECVPVHADIHTDEYDVYAERVRRPVQWHRAPIDNTRTRTQKRTPTNTTCYTDSQVDKKNRRIRGQLLKDAFVSGQIQTATVTVCACTSTQHHDADTVSDLCGLLSEDGSGRVRDM